MFVSADLLNFEKKEHFMKDVEYFFTGDPIVETNISRRKRLENISVGVWESVVNSCNIKRSSKKTAKLLLVLCIIQALQAVLILILLLTT